MSEKRNQTELEHCIATGEGWGDLISTLMPAVHESVGSRFVTELVAANNYATRLWFLLMLIYVFEVRIHCPEDRYLTYLLNHGYDYIYFVHHLLGDVYQAMFVLHARMLEQSC